MLRHAYPLSLISVFSILIAMFSTTVFAQDKDWKRIHDIVKAGQQTRFIKVLQQDLTQDEREAIIFDVIEYGHLNLLKLMLGDLSYSTDNKATDNKTTHNKNARFDFKINLEAVDKDKHTLLLYAARHGHDELCFYLIDKGSKTKAVDANKTNLLLSAAMGGSVKFFDWLLSEGFSLEYQNKHSMGSLGFAALGGHLPLVKHLVEHHKQDIKAITHGHLPMLYWAILGKNPEVFKYLVKQGADPRVKTNNDNTLLHWAAFKNQLQVLQYLIENQYVAVNTKNKSQQNAYMWGAESGNIKLLKYLEQQGADYKNVSTSGWTPIHGAAYRGFLDVVKYLLEEKALPFSATKSGTTPTTTAIRKGHTQVAKYLFEFTHPMGQDQSIMNQLVNQAPLQKTKTQNSKENFMYIAAVNAQFDLLIYFKSKGMSLNLVQKLKALEAFVKAKDFSSLQYLVEKEGYPVHITADQYKGQKDLVYPLFAAIKTGDIKYIEYLIKKGAQVNTIIPQEFASYSYKGRSALHFALEQDDMKILKYILDKHQPDVNQVDDRGYTPLMLAATKGQIPYLEYLLTKGANPLIKFEGESYNSNNGNQLLHFAVLKGHLEMVKYLVNLSLYPIDDTNGSEFTSLMLALKEGHVSIAEYLLEHGAQIDKIYYGSYFSMGNNSAWHFAVESSKLATLNFVAKHSKIKVDRLNKDHKSPLMLACKKGYLDLVKKLIAQGANSKQVFKGSSYDYENGNTLLHFAATSKNLALIKYLVEEIKLDPQAFNAQKSLPLHLAIKQKNTTISRYLTSKTPTDLYQLDKEQRSLLHLAAREGNLESFKNFMKAGLSLTQVDKRGYQPIHYAAESGNLDLIKYVAQQKVDLNAVAINLDSYYSSLYTPLHVAIYHNQPEVALWLIKQGVDIHAVDRHGNTALHLAASNGKKELVKLLIDQKAKVNQKNDAGSTPLLEAVSYSLKLPLIEYLLSVGADIRVQNESGETISNKAARYGHTELLQLCIKNKLDLKTTTDDGSTLLHSPLDLKTFTYLVEQGLDINQRNELGRTPAFYQKYKDVLVYALKKGADLSVQDDKGNTILYHLDTTVVKKHLKFLLQHVDINSRNEDGDTVLNTKIYFEAQSKLFIEHGINVNQANEVGDTAIFKAVEYKQKKLINLLIKNKADLLHRNRQKQTVLTLAIHKKNLSLVKFLLASKAYPVQSKAFQEALNEAQRIKKKSPEILAHLQSIKKAETKTKK